MSEGIKYNLLAILLGVIALALGIRWKRPSYGGGYVHKYKLIIIGFLLLIFGFISLFETLL